MEKRGAFGRDVHFADQSESVGVMDGWVDSWRLVSQYIHIMEGLDTVQYLANR